MKTRSSLDFDGLDGILEAPTQSKPYQKRRWTLGTWWLLPILGAIAAIILSLTDSQITTPKTPAQPSQLAPTQKPTALSVDDSALSQALTDDKQINSQDIALQVVQTPPNEQNAVALEPNPSQFAAAIANPMPAEILYTVHFNLDSSKLSLMTPPEIEAAVIAAKRCPGKINLTGHTCNLGSARTNKALGLTRARRVKKLLTNNGIDPKRIIAASAGMDNPAATNDTQTGRKLNRRVDLTCLDH